ncbi:AAA family ATPase [Paracnuella aquatica]|uniref:AAA family ATPase n=1 Tax=Paracnuella aquatica TaxID=2268757 RepID=UPI000DEF7810|nr:AAA family ATPase [Paracnuella aquatica]RPD43523.1 AAA family ATPase [Paracnuella aquatica]
MEQTFQQKTMNASSIFGKDYLEGKLVYLYFFNKIPSVSFVNGIDGEKVCAAIKDQYADMITAVYAYRPFDKKGKRYEFDKAVLMLRNGCVIEIGCWYAELFHDDTDDAFVAAITELAQRYKEKVRRKPLEMNLIVSGTHGLELRAMEVKRKSLDLDLFYDDDFKEVHGVIYNRLNRSSDKGIVLLHGLPGTGKTTYLRYLIGKIKKRVLFLSPNIAGDLMNPAFIDLLIDNPNTVVIIEDAENIIMDRKASGSSAVSNLLNISDGLLADFLNVQLICTFNSSLTLVDNALMRKGRLIAKYEFGKLGVHKAQRLSDHLGFDTTITRPMTVAEISNQADMEFEPKRPEVIGFRSAGWAN